MDRRATVGQGAGRAGALAGLAAAGLVVAGLAVGASGPASAQTYGGRLVISDSNCAQSGCTFSGNYESTDPNAPAIEVNTSRPVTIVNSRIRSRGPFILSYYKGANLTVRNTYGYGVHPGVAGKRPGRFVDAQGFRSVTVENCTFVGTSGLFFQEYWGDGTSGNTVTIRYNIARNIDGRYSTTTGWRQGNEGDGSDPDFDRVNFVKFDKVRSIPYVDISWNEVLNDPYDSRVEDNINIYGGSSGTSASRIKIHDNFIHGAYAAVPGSARDSYSGGGILLSDAGSSHVEAYNNVVVSTSNYGLSIQGGVNCSFHDNKVVCAGQLYDGTWHTATAYSQGATIYNAANAATWSGHSAYNNSLALLRSPTQREDAWFVDGFENERPRNIFPSANPTREAEVAEFASWRRKLASNAKWLGPDFSDMNLLWNGGFEKGNNGWHKPGGGWIEASQNAGPATGAWCMTAGETPSGRVQYVRLRPGAAYTLRGSCMVSRAGEQGTIFLDFYSSSGAKVASGPYLAFTSTSYATKSSTFTAPAGTSYAQLWLWGEAKTGAGSWSKFDNLDLR